MPCAWNCPARGLASELFGEAADTTWLQAARGLMAFFLTVLVGRRGGNVLVAVGAVEVLDRWRNASCHRNE